MPHKRYVKETIFQRAAAYLGDDRGSYRQAVRVDGRLIGYEADRAASSQSTVQTPTPAAIDERCLSPSTVWRWVGWLGGLLAALRLALQLIREKDANATLHRQVCTPPPCKYRSPRRRTVLQQALRLLRAAAAWEQLFGRKFFPHLGMADGFG